MSNDYKEAKATDYCIGMVKIAERDAKKTYDDYLSKDEDTLAKEELVRNGITSDSSDYSNKYNEAIESVRKKKKYFENITKEEYVEQRKKEAKDFAEENIASGKIKFDNGKENVSYDKQNDKEKKKANWILSILKKTLGNTGSKICKVARYLAYGVTAFYGFLLVEPWGITIAAIATLGAGFIETVVLGFLEKAFKNLADSPEKEKVSKLLNTETKGRTI